MSAPEMMPFYHRQYIAFTCRLTPEEHGAFLLLLMHRWQREGMPKTDQQSANVCRLPLSRWMEIKPTITDLFEKKVWGLTVADHVLGVGVKDKARPSLSPSVKQAVRERDGEACTYCGSTNGTFEIDHIIPWSRGGTHDIENLTLACQPCNRQKSDRTPEEWLQ